MTAAIPEDIMQVAENVEFDVRMAHNPQVAVGIIAQALQAERDRATEAEREKNATIAEAHGSPDIAARIRG